MISAIQHLTEMIGQCPAVSPPALPSSENYDGAIPTLASLQSIQTRRNGSEEPLVSDADRIFLTVHRPDEAEKCLIKPSYVSHVLKQQAQQMIIQEMKEKLENQKHNRKKKSKWLSDNSICKDDSSEWMCVNNKEREKNVDGKREDIDIFLTGSFASNSVNGETFHYTKYSDSTARIRNVDAAASTVADTTLSPETLSTGNLVEYKCGTGSGNPSAAAAAIVRIAPIFGGNRRLKPFNVRPNGELSINFGTCAQGEVINTIIGGREQEIQLDPFKMEKFMSILTLKMTPKLMDFYENQFIKLIPHGKHEFPTLRYDLKSWSPIKSNSNKSNKNNNSNIKHKKKNTSKNKKSRTAAAPLPPHSSPVRLAVSDDSFMDLVIKGSLGLFDRGGKHQDTPLPNNDGSFINYNNVAFVQSSTYENEDQELEHYIVLVNKKTDSPVAVCAIRKSNPDDQKKNKFKEKIKSGKFKNNSKFKLKNKKKDKNASSLPSIRIYGTKRRIANQKRAALTSKLGLNHYWKSGNDFALYAWAEIITHSIYPNPFNFSIYMCNSAAGTFEYKPSYKATNIYSGSPTDEIRVIGRTKDEEKYTGCAILTINKERSSATNKNHKATGNNEESNKGNSNEINSTVKRINGIINNLATGENKSGEAYFKLSVSRGIDPALFICFVAIVDEVMEYTMRKYCEKINELLSSDKATRAKSPTFIPSYNRNNDKISGSKKFPKQIMDYSKIPESSLSTSLQNYKNNDTCENENFPEKGKQLYFI